MARLSINPRRLLIAFFMCVNVVILTRQQTGSYIAIVMIIYEGVSENYIIVQIRLSDCRILTFLFLFYCLGYRICGIE